MIKIVIADDHAIVRRGLRALLAEIADMEVAGEATDGRQAVQLVDQLKPDIAVLDIGMPNLNGLDAATQILRINPKIGIVMLSMYNDESYLLRALEIGVKGYLLKDNADEDIERAIRSAMTGHPFFSQRVAQMLVQNHVRLLKEHGSQDSYSLLTEREKEVLQLLAEGKSNKEVAAQLDVSPYTIEAHRANLMQKLGFRNVVDIVLYAVRKGIVTP